MYLLFHSQITDVSYEFSHWNFLHAKEGKTKRNTIKFELKSVIQNPDAPFQLLYTITSTWTKQETHYSQSDFVKKKNSGGNNGMQHYPMEKFQQSQTLSSECYFSQHKWMQSHSMNNFRGHSKVCTQRPKATKSDYLLYSNSFWKCKYHTETIFPAPPQFGQVAWSVKGPFCEMICER